MNIVSKNKIKTKEELLESLKEYRGILKEDIFNYLESLVELEISVIKENINYSNRRALSELEIYKNIARYNIYNRAKNLFKQQNGVFIISENNEELSVSTKLNDRYVKLFDFDYKEIHSNTYILKIPNGFKSLHIGYISLFQLLENKEMVSAELNRIKDKLESLYNEKNPYYKRIYPISGNILDWNFYHNRIIEDYEKQYRELSKKELSDDEKKEIEITKQFYELLTEDFGLASEDFEDVSNEKSPKSNKTLIKRMPNLYIIDNIKYI